MILTLAKASPASSLRSAPRAGYHARWKRGALLQADALWRGFEDPSTVRCEPLATNPLSSGASRMIERLTAYISGDVQGVGYRAYARRCARTLGLVGYTRNLADGAVEVVAEGPHELLSRLFAELRRGPISADVTDARATWSDATGEYQTFTIRF